MIHNIVLGGGCFWGMEELFRARPGVTNTEVGYAGGQNENPTYDNHPGHAEVLRVEYDDTKTSLDAILDYFFTIHDPTTLNRQGNDIGTSYRSVLFFTNDTEEQAAKNAIQRAGKDWKKSIITTIEHLAQFYSAEEYHQDYLQKNPGGYTCHYERSF